MLDALKLHAWPGNIRELRNVIQRAVALAADGPIRFEHLPSRRGLFGISLWAAPDAGKPSIVLEPAPALEPTTASPIDAAGGLGAQIRELEQRRIREVRESCAGNQTRAAQILGISRKILLARLDAFGIRRPRERPQPLEQVQVERSSNGMRSPAKCGPKQRPGELSSTDNRSSI